MTGVVLRLDIVSAEKSIFSGAVAHLSLTGEMGDLGIYPGHAPLVTFVKPGEVHAVLPEGQEETFYVSGGMLEVQPFVVTLLADTVLRMDELDEAAALAAREQAQRTLSQRSSDIDFAKATAELADAIARLRSIQRLRKHVK